MRAARESIDAYVQRLADEWSASRLKTYAEYGWDVTQVKAWREGGLHYRQEPAFTIVIGHRDSLIVRGICATGDFPEGRKRMRDAYDGDGGGWRLHRRARDVYELFVSGPGRTNAIPAFRAHLRAAAKREIERQLAEPAYHAAFKQFLRRCTEHVADA